MKLRRLSKHLCRYLRVFPFPRPYRRTGEPQPPSGRHHQYLQAVQSLSQEMKQNIKVSKLEHYLKNDFSNIRYKQNFLKEIVMDEVEEKKEYVTLVTDTIATNNKTNIVIN